MLRLLAAWREAGRTVIHVRHVSKEPTSTFRPGQPGVEFKPGFVPLAVETIVEKSVPTAFIGTSLEALLRARGADPLVIVGVITNNSVEATARVSGNLGFNTIVVSDGTFTFGKADFAGTFRSAKEVHSMSLANLNGEYATVLSANTVLAAIKAGS
ncbi:MAG TPA: cysteine hydrolase family protein [Thermoanaerobaculia bacterium]|nr:cysteine hydrolase family protein [Thermoanaerobaculia bacterium]